MVIDEFTKLFPKHCPWKVDWFGEVQANPRIHDEPQIQVYLSPFVGNPKTAYRSNSIAWRNRKLVSIGVGQLPVVHIGSIWYGGRKRSNRVYRYIRRKFRNVQIFRENLGIVRGDKRIQNEPLLEANLHLLDGSSGQMARCLTLPYNGDPTGIIIPCVEIARFYFMQSSALARTFITPTFSQSDISLYDNKKSFWKEEGHLQVYLARGYSKEDGWIAARLLLSEYARNSANFIYESRLRNFHEERTEFIEAYPPFEGETDLVVHGININSQGRERFFVFWIESCSGPWPLVELTVDDPYWREGNASDEEASEAGPKIPSPRRIQRSSISGEILVSDHNPPSLDQGLLKLIIPQSRFTPLAKKDIHRPDKKELEAGALGTWPKLNDTPSPQRSTGGGSFIDSPSGPLNIVADPTAPENNQKEDDQSKFLSPSLHDFSKALEALSLKEGVTVRFLQVGRPEEKLEDKRISLFPIRDFEGKISWSYYVNRGGVKVVRQAWIAEIIYSSCNFYLVEAQQRKNKENYTYLLAYHPSFHEIGEDTLWQILLHCAKNRGRWLKNSELTGIKRIKVHHRFVDEKSFANKILEKIKMASKG